MTHATRRSFLNAVVGVGSWAVGKTPRPAAAQEQPRFDPSQPLPANLPVPMDDGACKHLPGLPLPSMKLRSTRDRWVDLTAVKAARGNVYFYPRRGRRHQHL